MEKTKELELDIQYLKNAYSKSVLFYDTSIKKLKNNKKLIDKRKDFILSQFKIIFNSERLL